MIKNITLIILLFISVKYSYSQPSWSYVGTIPAGADINTISVVGNDVIFVAALGNYLYRSLDGGNTWELKNNGLGITGHLYGISAIDSLNCWVGWVKTDGSPASIYRTTDGGDNWTLQWTLNNSFIDGIKMFSLNYGIAIADPVSTGMPFQLRFTTNGGANWYLAPGSPVSNNDYGVLNGFEFLDTNVIWVGSANTSPTTGTCNIYKTTNGINGTWTKVAVMGTATIDGLFWQAIAFTDKNNGMAGSNGGDIIKTTDGGATWTQVTPPAGFTSFAVTNMFGFKDGSNLIRFSLQNTTTGYHSLLTTNYGSTWTEEQLPSPGAANGLYYMQFVNSSLGYSGGKGGTFLKYSTPSTGIVNKLTAPINYNLSQNYPNPFNPSTVISFTIPQGGLVKLSVYNILGKEVAVLANEYHNAGNYNINFDAHSLSSGVYFYKLESGNFKDTKKLILIK
ncbi:MAG: T9SS type A sorting domain-containing protein [Ignavibacteriaceae bacterium]|nr:T9SS type A sorting domain-containing protein [Ignavibacteriaceae bacterium]